jgi:hypothetical protein
MLAGINYDGPDNYSVLSEDFEKKENILKESVTVRTDRIIFSFTYNYALMSIVLVVESHLIPDNYSTLVSNLDVVSTLWQDRYALIGFSHTG